MNRYDYLLSTYRNQKIRERKERILQSSRLEVDINGNGTRGYLIKEGVNTGKILRHKSIKSTDNW